MSRPTPEARSVDQQQATSHAPGTVLLEDVSESLRHHGRGTVILQPRPSNDPNDPLNWSQARKLVNFSIATFYTLMVSTIMNVSPIIFQDYNTELGISYADLNNTYAAGCAGLAVGCIVFIPLALKYGRRPVYIISVFGTCLTAIWQAVLRNYSNMFAANVVSGIFGAVSSAIVQMTVADVFFLHQRGTMTAIYVFFFNCGNNLSPVAAGAIASKQGWPWVYWWCAIFLGVSTVLFVFFYEETKYIPTTDDIGISPNVASTEGYVPGIPTSWSEVEVGKAGSTIPEQCNQYSNPVLNLNIPVKTYRQRLVLTTTTSGDICDFFRHIYQPLIVVCSFPAVTYAALQYGAMLAWGGILVTTESDFFSTDPYNFDTIGIGLLNMPLLIGQVLATIYSGPLSDWLIQWLATRNKGIYEPEMRLYLAIFPALLQSGGLFLYGYSVSAGAPWIIPCIGTGMFSFGNIAISCFSLTYLVDCYREIVGDALVGLNFIQFSVATGVIFASNPWIASLGFHNTTTSVGCLSLGISLLCIPMIIWGKKCRIACASRYSYYVSKQFDSRASI